MSTSNIQSPLLPPSLTSVPSAASQFWKIDHLRQAVLDTFRAGGINVRQRNTLVPLLTVNRQTFVDVVSILYFRLEFYNFPACHHRVATVSVSSCELRTRANIKYRTLTYARAVKYLDLEGSLPFCVDVYGCEGLVHRFPNIVRIEYQDGSIDWDGGTEWTYMPTVRVNVCDNGHASCSPSDYLLPPHFETFVMADVEVGPVSREGRTKFDRSVRVQKEQTVDILSGYPAMSVTLTLHPSQSLKTWFWIAKQDNFPLVKHLNIYDQSISVQTLREVATVFPEAVELCLNVEASLSVALSHFQWSKLSDLLVLRLGVRSGNRSILNIDRHDLPELDYLVLTFHVSNDIRTYRDLCNNLPQAHHLAILLHSFGVHPYGYDINICYHEAGRNDFSIMYTTAVRTQLDTIVATECADSMAVDSN